MRTKEYNEVCDFIFNNFHGKFIEWWFVHVWGNSSVYSPHKFKRSILKELLVPKYFTANRPGSLEDLVKLWEFIDKKV